MAIGLDDVRAHLNIDDHSSDVELAGFLAAATGVAEDVVGPLTPVAHVEDRLVDIPAQVLVLRRAPLVAVTSVATGGPWSAPLLVDPATLLVDLGVATISRLDGRLFLGRTQVAYVAGQTIVPGNVRLGVLELVRTMWQQTQQGGRPAFPSGYGEDGGGGAPMGFAVPNRVRELFAPDARAPRTA